MSYSAPDKEKRSARRRAAAGTAAAWVLFAALISAPAFAAGDNDVAAQLAALAQRLTQQEARIQDQERQLAAQRAQLEAQARQIETQRREFQLGGPMSDAISDARAVASADEMADMRGGGRASGAAQLILLGQADTAATATATPIHPVGEAPKVVDAPPIIAALPEGQGVLTPKGRLVLDPSIEYSSSSSNRLVYRGVEIVTGIQVGLIEANDAQRDTVVSALTARYGLTPRIEVEARVPYVYRNDRILTLAQRDATISREQQLDGRGIGDIEGSIRYQLNRGATGAPVFVAGLRAKSNTGTSPFDVSRDSFGVANELPTGSGFWGLSPSLSVLYPNDPVVLFGNLSYSYNAPSTINKTINNARIGKVDPGDSVGASVGFGFALNDRFSYSLGYSHQYLFQTTSEIGGTRQHSPALQVGALQFGMSLRVTPKVTVASSFEFGATKDSPDVRAVFRVPVGIQLLEANRAASRRSQLVNARTTRPWWRKALDRW